MPRVSLKNLFTVSYSFFDNKLVKENINFLKLKTETVRLPKTENIQQILNDLLDTYQTIPCAGIAANQIGHNKSIFIGLKDNVFLQNIKRRLTKTQCSIIEV